MIVIEKLFRYSIKKKSKQLIRKQNYRSYSNLQSIFILFDYEDYPFIERFIQQLTKDGKLVKGLGINLTKKEDDVKSSILTIVDKQGLNFFGYPNEKVLTEFLTTQDEMHAIFDLTTKKCLPLSYLLAQSTTGIRIGIKKDDQNLLDIIIDSEERTDLEYLCDQVLFYLKNIKSKQ